MFVTISRALTGTYHDSLKNQTLQSAAALSYYALLSIFPALILLSALMSYMPLPDFFQDSLFAIGRVVPPGTMPMVYGVLKDILSANSGTWLSLGTLGTLWVVSSVFDEMIDALNSAYDVCDPRPFWKRRLLALALAGVTVAFLIGGVATILMGPKVGDWVATRLSLSRLFLSAWPIIHWTIAVLFSVLAAAAVYFFAPNLKQRFRETLPGAIFSVACWTGLSYLLGAYFRYFANYNRTYGTLGGLIALMTWLYWAFFILVVGAELNGEIIKACNISSSVPGSNTGPQPLRRDRVA